MARVSGRCGKEQGKNEQHTPIESAAMLLILDNHDSFVHNLARYFERLGQRTCVVRSDAIDVAGACAMRPEAVVISPGPCTPRHAGASLSIVRELYRRVPLLGVCLGHQVIAEALGGRIVRAARPVHGQATEVRHQGRGIFRGLPSPMQGGRYHSLVVAPDSLPAALTATAWSESGEVMAIEHQDLPVYGVQFHPESILTPRGYHILANFLALAVGKATAWANLMEGELESGANAQSEAILL